jgi:hypothetical protein
MKSNITQALKQLISLIALKLQTAVSVATKQKEATTHQI